MLFPPLVNLWLRGAGRGISTERSHFIQGLKVRALGVSILQTPPDSVSLNWTALNTLWLGEIWLCVGLVGGSSPVVVVVVVVAAAHGRVEYSEKCSLMMTITMMTKMMTIMMMMMMMLMMSMMTMMMKMLMKMMMAMMWGVGVGQG